MHLIRSRLRVIGSTLFLSGTFAALLLGAVSLYEDPPPGYLRVSRYWRMITGDVQPQKSFSFTGAVGATKKGQSAVGVELKQLWQDHQFVLVSGTLRLSGKFTPTTTGAALPKKLRLYMKHAAASGATLQSKSFDMVVGSDGTIAPQNFSLTSILLVDLNENLQFTVLPVDKNLPAGTIQMAVAFSPPAAPRPFRSPGATTSTGPGIQSLQYDYGGYPGSVAKGAVSGRFAVIPLGASSLNFQGKLTVKGKITPDSGTTVPSKIRALIKHNDPNGTLLRTDKFDCKVKPNGAIGSQSFAFTTINAGGIKESLDISFVPLDKDLPDCELTLSVGLAPQ